MRGARSAIPRAGGERRRARHPHGRARASRTRRDPHADGPRVDAGDERDPHRPVARLRRPRPDPAAAARDPGGHEAGPARRGASEREHPEERRSCLGAAPAPRERRVYGAVERLDRRAVRPGAHEGEQGVGEPERRGEAVTRAGRAAAGRRVQLGDPQRQPVRVGDRDERVEARHALARCLRGEQLRPARSGVAAELAPAQPVAMRGDRPDRAGVARDEPRQRRRPGRAAREAPDDEARTRPRGQAGGERVEVAAGVADVVGGRVAHALAQAPDGGRAEGAGGRVEVGLVADLEALEPAAEAALGRAGEGERVAVVAVLEVQPHRHGRVEAAGETGERGERGRVDVVPHAGRPRAAVRRVPPRLLARRAADPQRQRRSPRRPRAAAAARRSPAAPARRTVPTLVHSIERPRNGAGTARPGAPVSTATSAGPPWRPPDSAAAVAASTSTTTAIAVAFARPRGELSPAGPGRSRARARRRGRRSSARRGGSGARCR